MDLLLDTVCVVDAEGRFVYLSAACESLLGYTPQALVGTPMIRLVAAEDGERTLQAAARIMAGGTHVHFQNRYVHRNGHLVDIMWSARWLEEHQVRLAVARDITPLKRAERQRDALHRISEAAFTAADMPALYDHIHRIIAELLPADLFLVASCGGRGEALECRYAAGVEPMPSLQGSAAEQLAAAVRSGGTLAPSSDSPGAPALDLQEAGAFSQCLLTPLISPRGVVGVLVVARADTERAFTGADSDLLQFVATQIAAVIERKQVEARLQHRATHDPLTDLPNRALFSDRVDTALERARRDRESVVLLYLDVDDFKAINDTLGHGAGDGVLRELARRLHACVRKSDTVARLGGDEFAILLVNPRGIDGVDRLMERIESAMAQSFPVEGRTLQLSVSIGFARYPEHGEDRHQLFRHADSRMFDAKGVRWSALAAESGPGAPPVGKGL